MHCPNCDIKLNLINDINSIEYKIGSHVEVLKDCSIYLEFPKRCIQIKAGTKGTVLYANNGADYVYMQHDTQRAGARILKSLIKPASIASIFKPGDIVKAIANAPHMSQDTVNMVGTVTKQELNKVWVELRVEGYDDYKRTLNNKAYYFYEHQLALITRCQFDSDIDHIAAASANDTRAPEVNNNVVINGLIKYEDSKAIEYRLKYSINNAPWYVSTFVGGQANDDKHNEKAYKAFNELRDTLEKLAKLAGYPILIECASRIITKTYTVRDCPVAAHKSTKEATTKSQWNLDFVPAPNYYE